MLLSFIMVRAVLGRLALALVTVVELPTLRHLGWWSPALCLLVHEKPVLEDPTLELFKYFITEYNTYC